MPNLRRAAALSLTALAFGAAACGDDNDDVPDGGGGQGDSPVNTDTPGQPEDNTLAPEEGGQQEEGGGTGEGESE